METTFDVIAAKANVAYFARSILVYIGVVGCHGNGRMEVGGGR